MRLGIDLSCAVKSKPSGVAYYATSLVRALVEQDQIERIDALYRLSRLKRARYRPRFRALKASSVIKTRLLTPALFGPRGLDLFHGPDARLADVKCPQVVTIHDVFSMVSDQWADSEFRDKKNSHYRRIAEQARRIIVPSENTKTDLEARFPEVCGRVRIVHHGIGSRFFPQIEEQVQATLTRLQIPRPFVLFVGLISKRKNCARMIEAFDQVSETFPNHHFVLAGASSHGAEEAEQARLNARSRERIHFSGFAAEQDLPALYAGASFLSFPTLYEGFGLPILEAMACRTPVLASAQSTPKEVGGEAPIFVDPQDVESIAEGMRVLLQEEEDRDDERRRAGEVRAQAFTWARCADQTLRVYRETMDRSADLAPTSDSPD